MLIYYPYGPNVLKLTIRRADMAHKLPQDRPNAPQGGPMTADDGTNAAPRGTQDGPRRPKTNPRVAPEPRGTPEIRDNVP